MIFMETGTTPFDLKAICNIYIFTVPKINIRNPQRAKHRTVRIPVELHRPQGQSDATKKRLLDAQRHQGGQKELPVQSAQIGEM